MYKRKFFLSLILVLIVFISYKYYCYSKLFDYENLKKTSSHISYAVKNFIFQYGDEDLTDKDDFLLLMDWIKKNYGVNIENYPILKNKTMIKSVNSEKYNFIVSTQGFFKGTNVVLNSKQEFIETKPNFLEYLFYDYNIILSSYKNTGNCFYYDTYFSNNIYSFFNKTQELKPSLRKQIILKLKEFENKNFSFDKANLRNRKRIFFKINNGKFSLICEKDKNYIRKKNIEINLNQYINDQNIVLPEWGVFSLRIK